MKLTDAERVILYRLHEVQAQNNPTDAKHHEEKMKVLLNGYHERDYDFQLSDPLPEKDIDFVMDVLDLYRGLSASFERLKPEEQEGIDGQRLRFRGFDGNDSHEVRLMGYAQFRVMDLGHWQTLKPTAEFNSHTPMADRYDRMLKAAKKIGPRHADYTAEEIKKIVSA